MLPYRQPRRSVTRLNGSASATSALDRHARCVLDLASFLRFPSPAREPGKPLNPNELGNYCTRRPGCLRAPPAARSAECSYSHWRVGLSPYTNDLGVAPLLSSCCDACLWSRTPQQFTGMAFPRPSCSPAHRAGGTKLVFLHDMGQQRLVPPHELVSRSLFFPRSVT